MPKRILHLDAVLTRNNITFNLKAIKGIKPFRDSISMTRHDGKSEKVAFSIRNGGSAGCGLDFRCYAYFELNVFNGQVRNQRHPRRRQSKKFNHSDVKAYVTYLYVLRDYLDTYFADKDVDYKFDISVDKGILSSVMPTVVSEFIDGRYLYTRCIGPNEERLTEIARRWLKGEEGAYLFGSGAVLVDIEKVSTEAARRYYMKLRERTLRCSSSNVRSNPNEPVVGGYAGLHFKVEALETGFTFSARIQSMFLENMRAIHNNCHSSGRGLTRSNRINDERPQFGFNGSKLELFVGHGAHFTGDVDVPINSKEHLVDRMCSVQRSYHLGELHFSNLKALVNCLRGLETQLNDKEIHSGIVVEMPNGKQYTLIDLEKQVSRSLSIIAKITVPEVEGKEPNEVISHLEFHSKCTNNLRALLVKHGSFRIQNVPFRFGYVEDRGDTERRIVLGNTEEKGDFVSVFQEYKKRLEDPEDFLFDLQRYLQELANSEMFDMRFQVKVDAEKVAHTSKHCNEEDFVMRLGAEFETGIRGVMVAVAQNSFDMSGNVYGSCADGDGLEIRTVAPADPDLFSWYGRFDSLCKNIRRSPNYGVCTDAGTHIHISINRADFNTNTALPGRVANPTWDGITKMYRRDLIANNWFSLMFLHTAALSFFDTFNVGSRRRTGFGHGFLIGGSGGFSDSRFKFNKYNDNFSTSNGMVPYFERSSLLRTNISKHGSETIHWEWRGTDLCPSALFTGLKVELLQAIGRKAIRAALDGKRLQMFDPTGRMYIDEIYNLPSAVGITDGYCRGLAIDLVEEVKEWLTSAAYRGLVAWAKYVDILREDTGSDKWFNDMEQILISAIGVDEFLSSEELKTLMEQFGGEPVSKKYLDVSKAEDGKVSKFGAIFGSGSLNHNMSTTYGSGGGNRTTLKSHCFRCGKRLGGLKAGSGYGTNMCLLCKTREKSYKKPKVMEYIIPKDDRDLIAQIVNQR